MASLNRVALCFDRRTVIFEVDEQVVERVGRHVSPGVFAAEWDFRALVLSFGS